MASSFFNRIFQSNSQGPSSQQSSAAAVSSSAPPPFKAMDLGVETIERTVWLTAILRHEDGYYHYKITFAGGARSDDGREHSYANYKGYIRVPEDTVNSRLQRLFSQGHRITMVQSKQTCGQAFLSKLIHIDHSEGRYVRQLQVIHGPNGRNYSGECTIPLRDETPTRWRYEAAFAVDSIEAVPVEPESKRTVVFRGVPHKGKKVPVEVWALNGEDFQRGKAYVHSVERRIDSDVPRVYLTINAPVRPRHYFWLQGDYTENGTVRYGSFVQVDEPEAENEGQTSI